MNRVYVTTGLLLAASLVIVHFTRRGTIAKNVKFYSSGEYSEHPRVVFRPLRDVKSYVAICAIVRHEASIYEWLNHYRHLGVGGFYIYDFNSAVPLAKYAYDSIADNDVWYEYYDVATSPAVTYNKCINKFSTNHRWIILLRTDEFVVPSGKFMSMLNEYENHGGLAFKRKILLDQHMYGLTIDTHGCSSGCNNDVIICNTQYITSVAENDFVYKNGKFTTNSTEAVWYKVLPQQHSHTSNGTDNVDTLVILWGQIHGSEYAWKSIHKHVLKPLNAHLATYFTDEHPRRTMLEDMARYRWVVHPPKDWETMFEQIANECGTSDNWKKLYEIKDIFLGGIAASGHAGSGAILLTFRWLIHKKIIDLNLAKEYKYIVISRPDQLHICDHPPVSSSWKNSVTIPNGEDYGGYADRHFFASTSIITKAINLAKDLVCNADKWYDIMKSSNRTDINSESAQKIIWDNIGVNVTRCPRTMLLIRAPEDPVSWSNGDGHPFFESFDVMPKYGSELDLVISQCTNGIGLIKEMKKIKTYNWRLGN